VLVVYNTFVTNKNRHHVLGVAPTWPRLLRTWWHRRIPLCDSAFASGS
jgi:hypothetical protein